MNDARPSLDETLAEVWQLLANGVAQADDPARLPVLGTVDDTGAPQLRTVALRDAYPSPGILEIHTDILSHKINELRNTPQVSLHIWHPDNLIQLRLSGSALIETADYATQRWDSVPAASRVSYGHRPPPGTPIPHSDAFTCVPIRERFAVVLITLTHIESVSLDPAGHRRAAFSRDDNWAGQWLSP